jgi:hypothetical protein
MSNLAAEMSELVQIGESRTSENNLLANTPLRQGGGTSNVTIDIELFRF